MWTGAWTRGKVRGLSLPSPAGGYCRCEQEKIGQVLSQVDINLT